MCHGIASAAFPEPAIAQTYSDAIQAMVFGDPGASKRIAILPDIFGCNPFYQGLATRFANKGALVFLIDTFAGLGDLPQATRDFAFERRHKLKDQAFVNRFVEFAGDEKINGVVGFCLGGLFIFELARQDLDAALVAYYPFPQGLENQDPLEVPFNYLDVTSRAHSVLIGDADASTGPEHIEKLKRIAQSNAALDLHVYENSGHGFLNDLTSDNTAKRDNAQRSLSHCEAVLGI